MSVEAYLARRYLFDRGHGTWGWLISWIATGSVALGVAVLIVTLSIMTGFREDIREKLLGVEPHMIISSPIGSLNDAEPLLNAKIKSTPEIKAAAPFIAGQVLIGRGSMSSGAFVKGIDPQLEPKVVAIDEKVIRGKWEDLSLPSSANEKPAILLGGELARTIGARVGDVVWAITPGSEGLAAFAMPKAFLFRVAGIIDTGRYDYDSSLAYTNIRAAQQLFHMEKGVSGIGVRLSDPDRAITLARELQINFEGKYWVRSWLSMNENLFSALKLEKTVMFTIFSLVTLVASFMIISNLLLIISQKVKEIGILRAMGATPHTIRKTFLFQGLFMGLVGNVIGVLLGLSVSVLLAKTNLIHLPADVYYIDHLPIRIVPTDILAVVAVASIIVLAATSYPAHKASQLDPLDAIRFG